MTTLSQVKKKNKLEKKLRSKPGLNLLQLGYNEFLLLILSVCCLAISWVYFLSCVVSMWFPRLFGFFSKCSLCLCLSPDSGPVHHPVGKNPGLSFFSLSFPLLGLGCRVLPGASKSQDPAGCRWGIQLACSFKCDIKAPVEYNCTWSCFLHFFKNTPQNDIGHRWLKVLTTMYYYLTMFDFTSVNIDYLYFLLRQLVNLTKQDTLSFSYLTLLIRVSMSI